MARLPRLYVPGEPQYVMLRGTGNTPAFRDEQDYQLYVDCLRDVAREHGVAIHAWALMPDAIHLVATPSTLRCLSLALQAVGRRYVATFNRRYRRSGPLWEGRYRSTVFEPVHFLLAQRTVESEPVSRGHTATAAAWRWSSHRHHVGLELDPMITDHAQFWAIGNTPFERQRAWLGLCEEPIDSRARDGLIEAATKGWVFGSDLYRERVSGEANRRITPLQRGRPRGRLNTKTLEAAAAVAGASSHTEVVA